MFETRGNSSERPQQLLQQSLSRIIALLDAWQTPDLQIEPTILCEASSETTEVDWDMAVLPWDVVVLPCALLAESVRTFEGF